MQCIIFSWPTLFKVLKNSDPPPILFIAHPHLYFMTGPLVDWRQYKILGRIFKKK